MIRDLEKSNGSPVSSEEITFRRVAGDMVRVRATVVGQEPAPPAALDARQIQLADGTRLRQLRATDRERKLGYEHLDNEILAGLRLRAVTETVSYPHEVSRLYGYEAASGAPFVLLEPYRGEPLTLAGRYLLESEQHQFRVSLLTGLCWLATAGIAHRAIEPGTVRWDGQQVQITDFSVSTLIGAPRQQVGKPPWAAIEQRPGSVAGQVSIRDDIWAAGRLIFYVYTGEELRKRSQIEERPELRSLLAGIFGPPEKRPTACDLLHRLHEDCTVPEWPSYHTRMAAGLARFHAVRADKHPGVAFGAVAGDGLANLASAAPETEEVAATQLDVDATSGNQSIGQRWSVRRLLRSSVLALLFATGLAITSAGIIPTLVR